MPISLNSPKYADVNSLAYQMHKKQQNRKRRKNPFVPELFERHFRRNEGTTDHATIPAVTLTGHFVIEFDLLPDSTAGSYKAMDGGTAGGSNRLDVNISSGVFDARTYFTTNIDGVDASTISAGVFHKIRLTRDATNADQSTKIIDHLLVRVGDTGGNFPGIIANLKIYDAGTLVRDYKINDNTSILADSASGEDGTVINGNPEDWGLFQQQTTGEWLGEELVTQQDWENPFSIGSEWSFTNNQWTLNGTGVLSPLTLISTANQPEIQRLVTDVVSISGAALAVTDGAAGTLEKTSAGIYTDDIDKVTYSRQLYKRNGGSVTVTINKPSMKEVLNVA